MYTEIVKSWRPLHVLQVLMVATQNVFLCKKYNCTIWVRVNFLNIVAIIFRMKANEELFSHNSTSPFKTPNFFFYQHVSLLKYFQIVSQHSADTNFRK